MFWAIINNKKEEATPKKTAICPICNKEVIPKCGNIKVWHWAHKDKKDCDSWWEPESQWHKNWKNNYPKEQQEFTMGKHRADIRTTDRWIIELQNSGISQIDIIKREKYYKRMIWLLNGETLTRGLRLRQKRDIIFFKWKTPPKSWWFADKDIYIDLSSVVKKLEELLSSYKSGDRIKEEPIYEDIYYEYYTPEAEHIEGYNKRITGYSDKTKLEIKKIKERIELFNNNIFLIKRLYKKIPCEGWGIIISKEDFLKQYK